MPEEATQQGLAYGDHDYPRENMRFRVLQLCPPQEACEPVEKWVERAKSLPAFIED